MENDENIQETQPEQEIELSLDDSDETTEHQDKDWKAEAKKWRDEAFKLKNKKPQIIKEGSAPQTDLKEEVWTIAEFIREGYDRDDVDFILKNGGRTALKDPNSLVSLALKSKTEQKRAEDAASKATSGGSGEIIGKVTLEDLSKMSPEEMKKHLPHAE